jgi:hypothetical protein
MALTVSNILPPSNTPLIPTLQCTVTSAEEALVTVVFYLLNEDHGDSQDEVITGMPQGAGVYSGVVNPRQLTNGDFYTVLVVASSDTDSASGSSVNCLDNL